MSCQTWLDKMDSYVDGELSPAEQRRMAEHLRSCLDCGSHVLARTQLKRTIHLAGKSFSPSADLQKKIMARVEPRRSVGSRAWIPQLGFALAMLVIAVLATTMLLRRSSEQTVVSELTDLHVATLASANQVDVVSSDRHTVKPWFQGKVPFTFNLPELQDSSFELIGGRMTYLDQNPGAHLLFRVRKHLLSMFIFKDSPDLDRALGEKLTTARNLSFNVESWTDGGLRYVVLSDASPADLSSLRVKFQEAAR